MKIRIKFFCVRNLKLLKKVRHLIRSRMLVQIKHFLIFEELINHELQHALRRATRVAAVVPHRLKIHNKDEDQQ